MRSDIVFLFQILEKLGVSEKEILKFITVSSERYGAEFAIVIDETLKEIEFYCNGRKMYYSLQNNVKLKKDVYVFYFKQNDIELLEFLLKRFYNNNKEENKEKC